MNDIEQLTKMYGDPALAPPATETIHAGPLSVVITSSGDIRYIRYGEHELIRRVYAAVRASDWWTIPATITVIEKTVQSNSFRIVSEARYTAIERGIDFRATLTLTGESDGRVTFDFDGEALSDFERKRIGICVLHPADAKGAPVTITHTDGTTETGALPDTIAPHQPFFDIVAIRHTVVEGLEVEVTFSGDVFEMEDQRNWLDASFKTYSTPLALPSPILVKAGERIRQTVVLSPPSPPGAFWAPGGEGGLRREGGHNTSLGIVWFEGLIKPNSPLPLPPIGHIWLELDLAKPRWQYLLRGVSRVAGHLDKTVFVCLKNIDDALLRTRRHELILPELDSNVEWFAPLSDWSHTTGQLGSFVQVGRGSLTNFTELNRNAPKSNSFHPVFFAGNPQVHATDSLSISETPPMIAEAIRTAQTFANGRPIHVGPLTFTGPYAASDPRETAQFGEDWYKQILTHAIEAGADSVTLGANALPVLREWYAKEKTP